MFDWFTLHIAALVVTAALFGGMTFFMASFAPLVFINLPRETAAGFMRALFPQYFLTLGLVALLPTAILLAIASYRPEGIALAAVAALFFASRALLLPALNRAREAGQTRRADALHRASVLIHLLQWAITTIVLVRLAG
jgi:hypothetical protein